MHTRVNCARVLSWRISDKPLIEAGGDPSVADDRGRDALDIARERRLPKPLIDRLIHLKEHSEACHQGRG